MNCCLPIDIINQKIFFCRLKVKLNSNVSIEKTNFTLDAQGAPVLTR